MGYNPDNMRVTSGREGSYRSSEVGGTRPKGDPKAAREFKKVLSKDAEDEGEETNPETKGIIEETDGVLVAMDTEKKKVPMSLFDLTSGKVEKTIHTHEKVQTPIESLASVYSKSSEVSTKKVMKQNDVEPTDYVGVAVPEKEDKFTTRFSTEQADLSYVNPLAAAQPQIGVNLASKTEKATFPLSNIQEIIKQMMEKITEIKSGGKTETIVTLKHPPLFAGATIVVTAFDNAKNEFNIAIENLTQAAKNLMDMQNNRDALLLALEQKGYAVHILTATTLTENRPVDALAQEEQARQQHGGREGRREGRPQEEQG